jgi:hypothetical protein
LSSFIPLFYRLFLWIPFSYLPFCICPPFPILFFSLSHVIVFLSVFFFISLCCFRVFYWYFNFGFI